MYGLIRVCDVIFTDLMLFGRDIIDFLGNEVTINGMDYSYIDLMFGLGLPIVLTLSVAKWLIGIIT